VDDETTWLPNAVEDARIPRSRVIRRIRLANFRIIDERYRKAYVGLDTHEEGDFRNERDSKRTQ
jgi:hypothetical protein